MSPLIRNHDKNDICKYSKFRFPWMRGKHFISYFRLRYGSTFTWHKKSEAQFIINSLITHKWRHAPTRALTHAASSSAASVVGSFTYQVCGFESMWDYKKFGVISSGYQYWFDTEPPAELAPGSSTHIHCALCASPSDTEESRNVTTRRRVGG